MSDAFEIVDKAGPKAPWLTLVHGATQTRRVFDAQVPAFQDSFRLLLVDLAGHGGATDTPGPFGSREYTAGVFDAIDAAGIRRTQFWGTHTGTQVGLVIALQRPQLLTSLILEGAVIPGRPVPSVAQSFERARATASSRGLSAAQAEWFDRSPWFEVMRQHPIQCRAALQREMIEAFQGQPWLSDETPESVSISAADLRSITQPTLIVNGEFEVPDFLPAAEELQTTLPDARRVTIASAGGFPPWEFPQSTNAEVAAFLHEIDPNATKR